MRYWATVISLALDLDLHLHPRLNAASVAQPCRHKAFETTIPDRGPITTSNDLPCTSVLPPLPPLPFWLASALSSFEQPAIHSNSSLVLAPRVIVLLFLY